MTTTVAYTAQVSIQHYIVPMFMSEIVLEDARTAAVGGAGLTAWLDVADALSGNLAVVAEVDAATDLLELTVGAAAYPLDGTGAPIQLLNVTGAPISSQTNDETVITHDAINRGATITVGVSNTHTIAYKGMTVHKSVDHKILTVLQEYSVAQNLGFKWLRVGPGGTSEMKLCYGRLASKSEEGDAGALTKYNFTMNVLGEVYTIYDNGEGGEG
jgi:hypothetical protein